MAEIQMHPLTKLVQPFQRCRNQDSSCTIPFPGVYGKKSPASLQQLAIVRMDWSDEPATWRQLKSLKELGYTLERRLTRVEAAEIIHNLGGKPEVALSAAAVQEKPKISPLQLRHKVEQIKRDLAVAGWSKTEKMAQDLKAAMAERQQFWIDTCHGVPQGQVASLEIPELYQKFGCRFHAPSRNDVQYILDALDQAMPSWDKDHPGLFFQTLELNFPAVVRRPKGLPI
jgi:hypothetical protein